MPRRLPWEIEDSKSSKPKLPRATPRKRVKVDAGDGDAFSDTTESTPKKRRTGKMNTKDPGPDSSEHPTRSLGRTPSSSPPPPPPKRELMREGLDGDDIWIMVEDEFLETAATFTRHLHQAEYKRLKNLAKIQNASAINQISRLTPSDRLSTAAKVRDKSALVSLKAKSALQSFEDDEASEEEPWSRDTHLAALMSGPEKPSHRLARITGVTSNTRAAAGFRTAQIQPKTTRQESPEPLKTSRSVDQEFHLGDEHEQNDPRPSDLYARTEERSVTNTINQEVKSRLDSARTRPPEAPVPHRALPTSQNTSIATKKPRFRAFDAFDDFDMVPKRVGTDKSVVKSMVRGKKPVPVKKEESVSLDEIPTFL